MGMGWVLFRWWRGGLSNKMTYDQRYEEMRGPAGQLTGGRTLQAEETGKCKGPGAIMLGLWSPMSQEKSDGTQGWRDVRATWGFGFYQRE